jgi:hypothetical protein
MAYINFAMACAVSIQRPCPLFCLYVQDAAEEQAAGG